MKPHTAIFGMTVLAFGLLFCVSCRTGPPLPAADFAASGWKLRQGQAIWKPPGHHPELAGDLLMAVNDNGNYVIEFTKTPFAVASAQVTDGRWQLALGQHSWRGPSPPPNRFVWFQLSRALAGAPVKAPWRFISRADHSWRLDNPRSGESLQGQFFE